MLKPTSLKAGNHLQKGSHDIKHIFEKVRALNRIKRNIFTHFDPNIAKQCQVANLIGSKLVLLVNTASIATQLRYQARHLLEKFAKDPNLQQIKYIEYKVRLAQPLPIVKKVEPPKRKVEHLSESTSAIIHELADTIEDPKIREIMHRIASRKSQT